MSEESQEFDKDFMKEVYKRNELRENEHECPKCMRGTIKDNECSFCGWCE